MPESDFAVGARRLGFDLDDTALRRFETYRDLILDASKRFNLTAHRDAESIERRLFLDSLALGRALVDLDLLPQASRVLDIGSGAGLPGLPIKIVRSDLRLTLLEANAKRCAFLRDVVAALELIDANVIEARAEECARDPSHREAYDLVLARAVAPLPVLLEYTLPFLRLGGNLAAPKGLDAAQELTASRRALEALGGKAKPSLALEPPGAPPSVVILVEKARPTPDRYPRRPGIPSKRPL